MSERTPLQSRLRASARTALWSSLVLSLATGGLFGPFAEQTIEAGIDQGWFDVAFDEIPEVQLLRSYINVDTTIHGSEIDGAEFLRDQLRAVGIEGHIELVGDKEANFWALLPGENPDALILHHHIDVEPILEPEKWAFDPFGGEIDGPWIFGRGAFDMKSVAVAQLYALIEAKKRLDAEGRKPARSVLLLGTSGEEHGSELGARWLLAQHPELFENVWAVLTEGGILEATSRESVKYWGLSTAQKWFIEVQACAPSLQRLEDLNEDLGAVLKSMPPTHLTEPILEFLAAYGDSRDDPVLRELLRHPHTILRDQAAFDYLPPYLQALFRDESYPWPPQKDEEGGFYYSRIVLGLHHDSDLETALETLIPQWTLGGISLNVRPMPNGPASSYDHPLAQLIDKTIEQRHGDVMRGPHYLSYFANDSRFFRDAGLTSFGFTPFVFLSTDSYSMSGPDEHIALPAFVDGVALYRDLVARVVGLDPVADDKP
jgi:acetylornithine deacetylase/succinyl-diaminopimelate desuccinylase-like protein